MAGKPGRAGPKSDKLWADAVHQAVKRYHEETTADGKKKKARYLNLLADNLVKAGMKGDITALKEIGDRLDGKAVQPTENKHEHQGEVKVQLINWKPDG